jgi:hypothetical protein
VKPSSSLMTPPAVVITTLTGPVGPGGVMQVTDDSLSDVNEQTPPPTVTVARSRLDPLIVSSVPPAVGPDGGASDVNDGAAT